LNGLLSNSELAGLDNVVLGFVCCDGVGEETRDVEGVLAGVVLAEKRRAGGTQLLSSPLD
jgi:hypothetical protein